jgi:hypothetical protein
MIGQDGDVTGLAGQVDRLEAEVRRLALRLDESERGHRRLLRVAGTGLLLATVLLSAGGAALLQQGTPRLDVVGPNNDVRISIRVDPNNGSAGLEVLGVNGQRAIFLGTSKDGVPNLALYDPTGQRILRELTP